MHAVATLVAIEAALAAVAYAAARGSFERASLYLLGMTAPLEVYRTTIAEVNLSLFRLSLAVAVAVAVGVRLGERRSAPERARRFRARISSVEAAYVLLAAVVAASFLVHGEALFLGKRLFAVIVVGVVAIAVSAELARRTSPRTLADAIVWGSALPILASLWQVVTVRMGENGTLPFLGDLPIGAGLERARVPGAGLAYGIVEGATQRLKGTFVDPNHFGAYLIFVVAVALGLSLEALLRERRERAAAFGALTAAAAATLLGTYSRSALGATAVALVVMLVLAARPLRARTTRRQRRTAALVAAGFLAVVLIPLGSTLGSRLDPASAVNATTNAVHKANGEAGLEQFRKHPVYGIGVGGLGVLLNEEVRNSAADSSYVTVAAELGAVGIFALLLTAGFVLDALVTARARVPFGPDAVLPIVLVGAYVGFLGANVFYDQLWWRDFHFLVVGLIVAVTAQGASAARAASAASASAP